MSGEGEKYEGNNRLALLKYVDTISKKKLSDIFGLYIQTVITIYPSKFCLKIKRFATKFIIIY